MVWSVVCGDALGEMAKLDDASIDLILTDPPYYRQKNLAWDRQWRTPEACVAWFGDLCQAWQRVLKPNGSLYCFMGPDMVARCEVEMGKWLTVLNRIVFKQATVFNRGLFVSRKSRARNISEAEGRAKMALRVGGGTRSATFETQSVFFRKESTIITPPAETTWQIRY